MPEWTESKLITMILLSGIVGGILMFVYGVKYASIPEYSATGFVSILGGTFALLGTTFYLKADYGKGGKFVFVGGILAFASFLELSISVIGENPILIFSMPVMLIEVALENGTFFKCGVVGMTSALTGGLFGILLGYYRKPSDASYYTILLIGSVLSLFFGGCLGYYMFPLSLFTGLVLFFGYFVFMVISGIILHLPIHVPKVLSQIKEKWDEKCPICKKEATFELKGFAKTVLVCNSCSAEWEMVTSSKSTIKKLRLRKSAASGKGHTLLRKFYPLTFWPTADIENEPPAVRCTKCGTLLGGWICRECGNQVRFDSFICPSCGSRLQSENISCAKCSFAIRNPAYDKFEREQRAKGLVRFVDRMNRDRWGTPKQVREWKMMEMDMENNFQRLTPRQFEKLVAEIFKRMGYEVELTPKTADYGADVLARKGEDTVVIQVKRFSLSHNVSNRDIQRLLGSMWKYHANKAVFVTSSGFTDFAHRQAKDAPIELWNHEKFCEMIEKYILATDT